MQILMKGRSDNMFNRGPDDVSPETGAEALPKTFDAVPIASGMSRQLANSRSRHHPGQRPFAESGVHPVMTVRMCAMMPGNARIRR